MGAKQWLGIGVLGLAVVVSGAALKSWAIPPEPGDGPAKMERMNPPAPGHEGEEEGEMGGHRMMAELNLSEEQIAKLKTERLSTQKQMIRDMAEMKTLHLDLAEATTDDKPDMAKIEKLIKQISAQQEQLLLNRTKSFLFLRSLLTPEQKRKMDAMHMQRGTMGGGFERHGREGHGGK